MPRIIGFSTRRLTAWEKNHLAWAKRGKAKRKQLTLSQYLNYVNIVALGAQIDRGYHGCLRVWEEARLTAGV